jgi:outer membrane protein
MKKLFKVAIVAVSLLVVGNFAKAQTKIGYINFNELIRSMPEFKTVQVAVDGVQKQYVDQYTQMTQAYQAEVKKANDGAASMNDAQKTAEAATIQDMQKRIQDFQTDAQQKVEAKSNELTKPLVDKGKAAVTDVAKEKGYTYVFDSSQGAALLVSPDADDLLPAVKAKLNIK